jgi:flavin reductase (DIM6/NTAB) family NADH-FMN oxidoreductase RutF
MAMRPREKARPSVTAAQFKEGMRRLSASVSLITVTEPEGRNGMTGTAVCSVSIEPPILLVGVNRSASIHAHVVAGRRFGVNILRPRHRALADRFSSGAPGEARFAAGRWIEGGHGVPILEDALASFVCEVVRTVGIGTHNIFFGRVVEVRVADGSPLLYGGGQYEITLPSAPQAYETLI